MTGRVMGIRSGREASASRVRLKSVALPAEHGGWGFLLEPILLGLLVAGSLAGVALALAALGVFLLNQPLKLAIKDRLKGGRYPRTVYAERFALGYAALAALGFGTALLSARDGTLPTMLLPIGLAVPFALIQIAAAARNQGRTALAEISGALALGAAAPAIAIAGGMPLGSALVLWVLIAVRAVPSILYVRAYFRRAHGKPAGKEMRAAFRIHVAAMHVNVALKLLSLVQTTAILAASLMTLRALYRFYVRRESAAPKVIGMQELALGVLYVILCAA